MACSPCSGPDDRELLTVWRRLVRRRGFTSVLWRRGRAWGTRAASGSPPIEEEQMSESIVQPESLILITVEEAARRLSVGRSHLYRLMQSGSLRSRRIGGCRRIAVTDLEAFAAALPDDRPTWRRR